MNLVTRQEERTAQVPVRPKWGILTNHAVILVYVLLHPQSTVRAIASAIAITERATLAILRDLDEDHIVERRREGRRTTYSANFQRLSTVRRGGVDNPLTPRLFVESVIRVLFELSSRVPDAIAKPPPRDRVAPEALEPRLGTWGFFTNHMLILLAIAQDDLRTVRELAAAVGITERAAVGIVGQLDSEGIVVRRRLGRRNVYRIDFEAFRGFRGWSFGEWQIPQELVDAATEGVRAVAANR
jgi:DNA-binding MarR family transcriptional regulator